MADKDNVIDITDKLKERNKLDEEIREFQKKAQRFQGIYGVFKKEMESGPIKYLQDLAHQTEYPVDQFAKPEEKKKAATEYLGNAADYLKEFKDLSRKKPTEHNISRFERTASAAYQELIQAYKNGANQDVVLEGLFQISEGIESIVQDKDFQKKDTSHRGELDKILIRTVKATQQFMESKGKQYEQLKQSEQQYNAAQQAVAALLIGVISLFSFGMQGGITGNVVGASGSLPPVTAFTLLIAVFSMVFALIVLGHSMHRRHKKQIINIK